MPRQSPQPYRRASLLELEYGTAAKGCRLVNDGLRGSRWSGSLCPLMEPVRPAKNLGRRKDRRSEPETSGSQHRFVGYKDQRYEQGNINQYANKYDVPKCRKTSVPKLAISPKHQVRCPSELLTHCT